jgi:hypothetical protein
VCKKAIPAMYVRRRIEKKTKKMMEIRREIFIWQKA